MAISSADIRPGTVQDLVHLQTARHQERKDNRQFHYVSAGARHKLRDLVARVKLEHLTQP